MKKITTFLVYISLIVSSFHLQAQQKNQLNINVGITDTKYFPYDKSSFRNYLSLSYNRTINLKWQIWTSYTKILPYHSPYMDEEFKGYTFYQNESVGWDILYKNVPLDRYNVHQVDIGASYALYEKRRHLIVGLFGISYLNTKTSYVESGNPPNKYNDNVVVRYYYKNKSYIGPNIGIKYDYYLLHNYVNIGAHAQWKFYIGDMPLLSNIGVHVGFNF